MKICTRCKVSKSIENMRKAHKGTVAAQCNACCNEVKKLRKVKLKELAKISLETAKEEKKIKVIVAKRTFEFTSYVPEQVWTRNNGNVHIQSRGYQC